jgi:hypothetical protein
VLRELILAIEGVPSVPGDALGDPAPPPPIVNVKLADIPVFVFWFGCCDANDVVAYKSYLLLSDPKQNLAPNV